MSEQVRLRGNAAGLLVVLDDKGEFAGVRQRLVERLMAAGDLFHGADVTVDLGNRRLKAQELCRLKEAVAQHNDMRLTRVIHGGEPPGDDAKGSTVLRSGPLKTFIREAPSQPGPQEHQQDVPTLLVRGTVRSGQEIRNQGHVVVFGDVNPGAEVIATGDIIVLGSLRGVAHAGCSGDYRSVVAAVDLRPLQLRIAGFVGRPPDDEEASEGAEMARVREGRIMVESYGGISRGEDGVWGRPW